MTIVKSLLSWALILVSLAAAFVAIHRYGENNKTQPLSVDSSITITVTKAAMASAYESMKADGTIVPRDDISVYSDISGMRVKDVIVDEGTDIKEGDLLALLDAEALKNDVARLQADSDKAYDEYKRYAKMKGTGAVAENVIVQKEMAYKAARAELDEANRKLSHTEIKAPASGKVYYRNVKAGDVVTAQQPLFKIIKNNLTELEANIPENMIEKVKAGTTADVTVYSKDEAAIPAMKGVVRILSTRVDGKDRSATARIVFAGDIIPSVGTFGDAVIKLDEKKGFVLPQTALQFDDKGEYVWLIVNNVATKHAVKTILRENENAYVDGLKEGDLVASKAGAFLKEGDKVVISEKAAQ